jgi:hypothetical protein
MAALLTAGCSPKLVERVRTEYIEKEVLRDTTIYVSIEGNIQHNRVKDTLSVLENKWAKSAASVDSLGYLNHSLAEKKQDVPFKILYRDKIVRQIDSVDRPYPVKGDTIIKEVVPNWCWYILGAFIIQVVYFIIRLYIKFKKPL